jgi:[protein-PII] uridylyltransferase
MSDARSRSQYLQPIRQALIDGRARLKADYQKRPQPDRNLRAHTALVDRIITQIASDIELSADIALVAVGGYGRGFLFPASDVDILVLLPDAAPITTTSGTTSAVIEAFVGLLWDIGLEPAISVHYR